MHTRHRRGVGVGFTGVDGWVIAATGSGDPTLGEVQGAEGGL